MLLTRIDTYALLRYVHATKLVPPHVRRLPLGQRVRWARRTAGLSHDKLVERIGRSNRGHIIKIERGAHVPRQDLRDAIADACSVSRDLFSDEDDEDSSMALSADEFRMLGDLMSRLGHSLERT